MMRCDVLLFAQLADAVGTDRLEIEPADAATVDDALDMLAGSHPAIGAMRGTIQGKSYRSSIPGVLLDLAQPTSRPRADHLHSSPPVFRHRTDH